MKPAITSGEIHHPCPVLLIITVQCCLSHIFTHVHKPVTKIIQFQFFFSSLKLKWSVWVNQEHLLLKKPFQSKVNQNILNICIYIYKTDVKFELKISNYYQSFINKRLSGALQALSATVHFTTSSLMSESCQTGLVLESSRPWLLIYLFYRRVSDRKPILLAHVVEVILINTRNIHHIQYEHMVRRSKLEGQYEYFIVTPLFHPACGAPWWRWGDVSAVTSFKA